MRGFGWYIFSVCWRNGTDSMHFSTIVSDSLVLLLKQIEKNIEHTNRFQQNSWALLQFECSKFCGIYAVFRPFSRISITCHSYLSTRFGNWKRDSMALAVSWTKNLTSIETVGGIKDEVFATRSRNETYICGGLSRIIQIHISHFNPLQTHFTSLTKN